MFRYEGQKEDITIGFGVDGTWESEYVPATGAEFYYVKNGNKVNILYIWYNNV